MQAAAASAARGVDNCFVIADALYSEIANRAFGIFDGLYSRTRIRGPGRLALRARAWPGEGAAISSRLDDD